MKNVMTALGALITATLVNAFIGNFVIGLICEVCWMLIIGGIVLYLFSAGYDVHGN